MTRRQADNRRGYTLVEVLLVIGLVVTISAMVVPNFMREIEADRLPRSARQLRSLIAMVRAHASLDGKRYRIRFPFENEAKELGDAARQPLIECEGDPFYEPEVFIQVTEPWALGDIFLRDVWCAEVRLGRPSIEELQERRVRAAESIARKLEEGRQMKEEIEAERPPLFFETDGASDWATFVLTTAPPGTDLGELEEHPRVELISEGMTGSAWLQRPFYEQELDLFAEKGWPAVLRQDFLNPRELTEDDVLELRESQLRGVNVELKGRKLEPEE